MTARTRAAYAYMVATAALTGCRPEVTERRDAVAAAEVLTPDRAEVDADTASDDRPQPIHYDLMAHEWYRAGEPLIHDGRAHVPLKQLARGRGGELRRAGEYGGVTYYVRAERHAPDPEPDQDTLFVPVYEGYWLPFVPSSAIRTGARTAATAGPDS